MSIRALRVQESQMNSIKAYHQDSRRIDPQRTYESRLGSLCAFLDTNLGQSSSMGYCIVVKLGEPAKVVSSSSKEAKEFQSAIAEYRHTHKPKGTPKERKEFERKRYQIHERDRERE